MTASTPTFEQNLATLTHVLERITARREATDEEQSSLSAALGLLIPIYRAWGFNNGEEAEWMSASVAVDGEQTGAWEIRLRHLPAGLGIRVEGEPVQGLAGMLAEARKEYDELYQQYVEDCDPSETREHAIKEAWWIAEKRASDLAHAPTPEFQDHREFERGREAEAAHIAHLINKLMRRTN